MPANLVKGNALITCASTGISAVCGSHCVMVCGYAAADSDSHRSKLPEVFRANPLWACRDGSLIFENVLGQLNQGPLQSMLRRIG